MGWITKNSAEMQIDRRSEPYLGDALKTEFESDVLPRYPTRQAATLPLLHALQEEHGWLPFQALEEAADFLGLAASTVLDTATFYEEFWLEPKGKYVIWLCESISCELMGSNNLLDRVRDHLRIEPGETTDDGKFTLMTAQCLGSCGTAPCGLVNEELHENITVDNFVQVLEKLD